MQTVHFVFRDSNNNTMQIVVNLQSRSVTMCNQHHVALCLSNVAFMLNASTEERVQRVRAAALLAAKIALRNKVRAAEIMRDNLLLNFTVAVVN